MAWIHRYIGLTLGVWLFLQGLSGAMMVYQEELDAWLNAPLARVDHPVVAPDFDAMVAVVQAAYPDRAILKFERNRNDEHESAPFALSAPGATITAATSLDRAGELEVFVDPGTMKILGSRPYRTWFRVLKLWHADLFLPERNARQLIGVFGAIGAISVIAGIVLWLRTGRGPLRRRLQINPSSPTPRLLRDLHTVPGIYLCIFLAFQMLSGFVEAEISIVRDLVGKIFPSPAAPPAVMPSVDADGPFITPNQARDIALKLHPASDVVMMSLPTPTARRYSVRIFPTDEDFTRNYRQATIHAVTGQITRILDTGTQPLMRIHFIHSGQFIGWPHRVILVVAGFGLALFFPTGLYIWFKKRRVQGSANETSSSPSLSG